MATMAASPATPSPPTKPTAAPIANNNGKLEKIICPACSIIGKFNLFPKANSNPAAGKIAIGVIKAFPIFCTSENNFIIFPSQSK